MLKYRYIKKYNLYVQTYAPKSSPSPPRKQTKTKTKMFRLKEVKDIKKYIYVSSV